MLDRILVPLDGSALAECVLPHVVAVSAPFRSEVTLLRVLEPPPSAEGPTAVSVLDWQLRRTEAQAYLDSVATRLTGQGLTVHTQLAEGDPAERIVALARSWNVDLLILSSHGRGGLNRFNLSSVAFKIVFRAYVSVMVVRAFQPLSGDLASVHYGQIVLPMDCSQRAEHVLSVATRIARHHQARVLLLHVVHRPEMPRRRPLTPEETALADQVAALNREGASLCLEDVKSQLKSEQVTAELEIFASEGNPAEILQDRVERSGSDLTVLSAHGASGGSRWPYGGLTVHFIAYGTTPLLILQDLKPEQVMPDKAEILATEFKGR